MDNRPIGFFDSGIGGLTCIPALQKKLPNENIVYYGDTARTPYGSKSIETIKRFSFQICDYLVKHDVKMIVIACNTISATCLGVLRNRYPDIPIIGVIEPIANRVATTCTEMDSVGIIGTKVTIQSGVYSDTISENNSEVKLFSKACPAFVPLIEEGIIDNEIMDLTVKYYLDDFIRTNKLNKLVLGCTHFPFIRKSISRMYPELELLNPSAEVINEVERILSTSNMLSDDPEPNHICFASDLSENYLNMINRVIDESDSVRIRIKEFTD